MNIAQRLDNLIKERKVSRSRLARELGVHTSTVSNWLLGKDVKIENLQAICEYFQKPMDYFIGEQEKPAGQVADGLTKEDIDILIQIKTAPEAKKKAILELLKGWEDG